MPIKLQSVPNPTQLNNAHSAKSQRRARLAAMPHADVVLGVDPGLTRTGFAVLKRGKRQLPSVIKQGIIKPPRTKELGIRLEVLFTELSQIIDRHQPDVMVLEDVFSTFAHPRSALLMAHGRGVLLLAAEIKHLPLCHFLPNEIKQVVAGNGHATKEMMTNAVQRRLQLSETPTPHDVADALAIGFCFLLRQN